MIRPIACVAMSALLLLAMQSTALAQDVRVSISYNMSVKAKSDSAEDMAAAQVTARRAMYTMMAKECVVLEETIAERCKLTNFSVQSGSKYRRRNMSENQVNVRGSGTYKIDLK